MSIAQLPPAPENRSGWPWETRFARSQPTSFNPKGLPHITVVTPSFNQGDFLEETIRSVLLQEYPLLQYIVVDGGSTDQSHEILDKYREQISTIIREPDKGQSDAIIKGLDLADGEFFNWINSDDILMPGVLWELGENCPSETDLYTFSVSVFGENVDSYVMLNQNLNAKKILRADHYSFSQPGLWFRTRLMRECGSIDRELNYGFDWDLLVRYLAANPRVHYSATVGAGFRLHDQSKTSIESAKEDEAANRFRQELERIRDKLERSLPNALARASRLGRRREPWNEHLIEVLDDFSLSPAVSAARIAGQALREPRVRCSTRTLGALARLLSRYVRPKSSYTQDRQSMNSIF